MNIRESFSGNQGASNTATPKSPLLDECKKGSPDISTDQLANQVAKSHFTTETALPSAPSTDHMLASLCGNRQEYTIPVACRLWSKAMNHLRELVNDRPLKIKLCRAKDEVSQQNLFWSIVNRSTIALKRWMFRSVCAIQPLLPTVPFP